MKLPRLDTSKWTRRHVDVGGAILCVLITLPVFLTPLNPLLRPQAASADQQGDTRSLGEKAGKLTASLAAHRARLEELNRVLGAEAVRLEPARDLNSRLAKLTDLAVLAGLRVDEILPGSGTSGPHSRKMPIYLRARGRLPVCATFLHRLSTSLPDTFARSFELVGNPQKPQDPPEFRVHLVWHALPLDAREAR